MNPRFHYNTGRNYKHDILRKLNELISRCGQTSPVGRSVFMCVVKWQPLVAVVIMTGGKESRATYYKE